MNVSLLQLQQIFLGNILRIYTRGLRYPCDECEFASTTNIGLKRHTENKQKRVRYPCDKCEYSATRANTLRTHIEQT